MTCSFSFTCRITRMLHWALCASYDFSMLCDIKVASWFLAAPAEYSAPEGSWPSPSSAPLRDSSHLTTRTVGLHQAPQSNIQNSSGFHPRKDLQKKEHSLFASLTFYLLSFFFNLCYLCMCMYIYIYIYRMCIIMYHMYIFVRFCKYTWLFWAHWGPHGEADRCPKGFAEYPWAALGCAIELLGRSRRLAAFELQSRHPFRFFSISFPCCFHFVSDSRPCLKKISEVSRGVIRYFTFASYCRDSSLNFTGYVQGLSD